MANIEKALDIINERGGCFVDLKVTLENPYSESAQEIIQQIKEKFLTRVSSIRVTDYHNWSGEFHDGVYKRKYTCGHPSGEITILWNLFLQSFSP